jgi:hypothetical protein
LSNIPGTGLCTSLPRWGFLLRFYD